MVNPSSYRIWGLGALNHSFCALEHSALQRTSNHGHTVRKSETTLRNNWKMQYLNLQSQLRLLKFLTFITFWEMLRLQVALDTFLWVIWKRTSYVKAFPRSRVFSAHENMVIRCVEMKLRFGISGKWKIWLFRANWDSQNCWLSSGFWETFRLQGALENFLWMIW